MSRFCFGAAGKAVGRAAERRLRAGKPGLTVTQPAAAQIYLGTYENYTGTYTMSFQSQDGSTFDITFTVAATNIANYNASIVET